MINIDTLSLDIQCPLCRFSNTVALKQIRLRNVVICRGCKANIKLEDHLNTVSKTIRSFRRTMGEIEDQLRRIGTTKIRF